MANWKYSINISNEMRSFSNGEIKLSELTSALVNKIKNTIPEEIWDEIWEELNDLLEVNDAYEYDEIIDPIYDWADFNRIWIGTV